MCASARVTPPPNPTEAHLISCGHLHFRRFGVCVRGRGPVISDYAEEAATEHQC